MEFSPRMVFTIVLVLMVLLVLLFNSLPPAVSTAIVENQYQSFLPLIFR
jgi:hypothetical protein